MQKTLKKEKVCADVMRRLLGISVELRSVSAAQVFRILDPVGHTGGSKYCQGEERYFSLEKVLRVFSVP